MESYLKDGESGLFVPYKDVSAMRAAIARLLQDEAMRNRIGSEARAFAIQCLEPELFACKLSEYLKGLMKMRQ